MEKGGGLQKMEDRTCFGTFTFVNFRCCLFTSFKLSHMRAHCLGTYFRFSPVAELLRDNFISLWSWDRQGYLSLFTWKKKKPNKQQKRNPLCAETLACRSVWVYQQEETAFLMLKRIARHERCRCVMGSLALLEAAGPHGFMHLEEQSQRLSYQDDDGIRDIWTTAQERFFKPYNSI